MKKKPRYFQPCVIHASVDEAKFLLCWSNFFFVPFPCGEIIFRDGTSIILSDDVGQLYILSTGQGESQMDAKYEQVGKHSLFFSCNFS